MAAELGKFISEMLESLPKNHPDRLHVEGMQMINIAYLSQEASELTNPELLSLKAAADYLKVHPKTLYRYTRLGKLTQYRLGGLGRPRYLKEDLDSLMQSTG